MTVSDIIDTQSVASPTAAAAALPTCSPCPPTPEWTAEQCPPPAPATTPDPTTSSNPDYDTFVAVNAAPSNASGVAIKNKLNKNEIALNDYFIIKPSLLRALHDSDPYDISKHKPRAKYSDQQGQKLLLLSRYHENSK